MGILRGLGAVILALVLLFVPKAFANSATCILLKQQMSQYSHSKMHPTYRRAQRDYERLCNQPEPVKPKVNSQTQNDVTSTPTLTDAEKQAAEEQFRALEKQAAEQANNANVEQDDSAQQNNNSVKTDNPPELQASDNQKNTPTAPKPKVTPKFNMNQWQAEPVEQPSLLEAMMIPLIGMLVFIIAIIIYIKFVRSRVDEIKEEIKEKAQEMTKELSAKNVKKKKKSKGELDPEIYFSRQRIEVELASGELVLLERIIFSQYGIFVVLPQKQRGAIIGSAKLPEWKEQVGTDLNEFNSPINVANQCCFVVSQLLGTHEDVEPVIAFNDMAVFKSQFPINVMHKKAVNKYVIGFKELKFSDQQVDDWLAQLDKYTSELKDKKRLKEEAELEQNRMQHAIKDSEEPKTIIEQAEQEMQQQLEETNYPEPGSYEQSVATIDPDSDDVHRTQIEEKPAVDHIAELDAILNKAKEFSEKLDEVSGVDNSKLQLEQSDFDARKNDEVIEDPSTTNGSAPPTDLKEVNDLTTGINTLLEQQSGDDIHHEEQLSSLDINKSESQPHADHETLEAPMYPESKTELESNTEDESSIKDAKDMLASMNESEESQPENMVPHSEFKRRAAKRAVDDGMFDYLDIYDANDTNQVSNSNGDTSNDLENELAQSLAAGKGFLSELDSKDELEHDIPEDPMCVEPESQSMPAETPAFEEQSQNSETESNSGWRAIKAQMDQDANQSPDDLSLNESEIDANKETSGWRTLQQELDETLPTNLDDSLGELSKEKETKQDNKSSLFSNLELDPSWEPKPEPEKIIKIKPEDDPNNG